MSGLRAQFEDLRADGVVFVGQTAWSFGLNPNHSGMVTLVSPRILNRCSGLANSSASTDNANVTRPRYVLVEAVEVIIPANKVIVSVRHVEPDCVDDFCGLLFQEVFNLLFPERRGWLSPMPFSSAIPKVIGALAYMVRVVALAGPQAVLNCRDRFLISQLSPLGLRSIAGFHLQNKLR